MSNIKWRFYNFTKHAIKDSLFFPTCSSLREDKNISLEKWYKGQSQQKIEGSERLFYHRMSSGTPV